MNARVELKVGMTTTSTCAFLMLPGGEHLLTTEGECEVKASLEVASSLSEGVRLFARRLADAVNEGELVYMDELVALSFCAEAAAAITASVSRSIPESVEVQGGRQ
ncbi:hypothetical protein [Pseudomonas schmalbachii]|uniref:DUF3077 domain-containing protein n=1 Tax=Pseudomonas schmalbachii TaxID=2816993 RepID=A0ABS3TKB0_9PSED|nr:hypothetical protein [Pseudomonas schmalbachii]MBO3274089.1 hypothetical protein [Pseudomonas schmalbachii]